MNFKKNTSSYIALVLMPFLMIFIQQLIYAEAINDFSCALIGFWALFVSFIILFSLYLTLYGIFKKLSISWSILSAIFLIILIINYYKIKINGAPMTLTDFEMTKELSQIASFALPQIKFSFTIFISFIIFVLFIFIFKKIDKITKITKKARIFSMIFGLVILFITLFLNFGVVISDISGASDDSPEEAVENYGLIAGWYFSYSETKREYNDDIPPIIFSQIEEIKNDETTTKTIKPNIIFLMSESFFDVERLSNIEFQNDPIPTFHKLSKNYSSGKFVSNMYCGGTGYVEMEVLTGISSYLLKRTDTLTSLPESVYSKIPSITDVFSKNGYKKTFIHSYTNQLYNRSVIYNALGFDNIRFSDSFDQNAEKKGGYISDMELSKEIIKEFENKGDNPLMLFGVSMQNHQPYKKDKFEEKSNIIFNSDYLTTEDKQIFDSYIYGLKDADTALEYLIDYFSNTNEPVMLVFFGDHLPNLNLSNGENIYKKLGYLKKDDSSKLKGNELLDMLMTDYVIWDNLGLKKEDENISCAMLGVKALKLSGLELTNYYKWILKYVYNDYLIYRSRIFATSIDDVYDKIPEKYENMMQLYASVIYDIVYGENILFEDKGVN